MNYGNIKPLDVADGEGVRVSLFVSGCRNRCENCFQPETWNFDYGQPYTAETQERILSLLEPFYVDGLTLLGGEPFEPENQRELVKLLRRVRTQRPEKTVWCYSGYTLEQIQSVAHPRCEVTEEMLSLIDVLVDGRFVEALKDISLKFRGSSNQRIIDLRSTLKTGEIVLYDK